MPETTLAEGSAKQAAYEAWEQERSTDPQTLAADLYTAAFFLPKPKGGHAKVPTTQHLLLLQSGQEIPGDLELGVEQAAKDFRFFHWHLRFGEVMEKGGFDCVLGNPPWETMSPDVKEWFATYDPAIRNNSPEGQSKIMESLLSNTAVREAWDAHCNQLYGAANFIKSSGRYRLFAPGNLGKGDFNTYRFFVELSLLLCSLKGAAAMIVPENLYNGANAMALRKVLTEERGPLQLRGFENAKKHWFPDIDSRSKFCLYISPSGPKGEHDIDAAFCIHNDQQLKELASRVTLPRWMAREIGGEALAIPEIRSRLEVEILNKLYSAYPSFSSSYCATPGSRPYEREIDMDKSRSSFTENIEDIPIFEGNMIELYDYRAKGYISGRGRSAAWEPLTFNSPTKKIVPQWRIPDSALNQSKKRRIADYRIAYCKVCSPTNQRSLVSTIVPKGCICGDAVPTIYLGENYLPAHLLWTAIANTLAIDFLARKKVALNMTFSIVDTLPLPASKPLSEAERRVTRLAASLSLAGPEMDEAASIYAEGDPDWPRDRLEDPLKRHIARAEIEAIYAMKILGLSRTELEFILDPACVSNDFEDYETFGALKRAELRQFGEYRTQRLVLEAWDRLFGG
jgi:hypothetical protein